jgi:hypothetical protein
MDLMNERMLVTHEDQSELIKNLRIEVDELKAECEKLKMNAFQSDTRTPGNSNKKLYILEQLETLPDGSPNLAGNMQWYPFELCADSTNDPIEICRRHFAKRIFKTFIFPASMNIKQTFHNKYRYQYYFEYKDLGKVIDDIKLLKPKNEL